MYFFPFKQLLEEDELCVLFHVFRCKEARHLKQALTYDFYGDKFKLRFSWEESKGPFLCDICGRIKCRGGNLSLDIVLAQSAVIIRFRIRKVLAIKTVFSPPPQKKPYFQGSRAGKVLLQILSFQRCARSIVIFYLKNAAFFCRKGGNFLISVIHCCRS